MSEGFIPFFFYDIKTGASVARVGGSQRHSITPKGATYVSDQGNEKIRKITIQ